FAREAFRLMESSYERVLEAPADLAARGATLLGAYWAGNAISASMLGATHACANPLTARYGTTHGVAIALMLPHVVRWNGDIVADGYAELIAVAGWNASGDPGEQLADRVQRLAMAGDLPVRLRDAGVVPHDLPALAA